MIKRGRSLSPVQLETQGVHVCRVCVGSWCEAEPVQEILPVILLAVVGLDHSSVLLFVVVEKPDCALPAGKFRLVVLQDCRSRWGGCAGLCLVSRYRGVLFRAISLGLES